MKNCILINSYTNTNHKLELLRESIKNLKKLNLDIILCSGCIVPDDILNQVEYFILSKEKLIKSAFFYKEKFNQNKPYVCAHYFENKVFFHDCVDLTVCRNIKLLFSIAKFYGYNNAAYLDYDTIFFDTESYIGKYLNILNENKFKMCVVESEASLTFAFHLTHFFSNVDFLLENFKLATCENDLKDDSDANDTLPWAMPEISFYKSFVSNESRICKIDYNYYSSLIDDKKFHTRHDDINFLIKQNVRFIKRLSDNKVFGMVLNTSTKKLLNLIVKTKYDVCFNEYFNPNCWHITNELDINDFLEVTLIEDGKEVTINLIYDSEDKILAYEY